MVKQISQSVRAYFGVDPGSSSGSIVVKYSSGKWAYITIKDKSEKELLDWVAEKRLFGDSNHAIIEWIHPAIYQVAKASMSKLYGSYMLLRMLFTAVEIPWEIVTPMKWQPEMGIPKPKGKYRKDLKGILRDRAEELHPSFHIWKTPKTVGLQKQICDALLLAELCRRRNVKCRT